MIRLTHNTKKSELPLVKYSGSELLAMNAAQLRRLMYYSDGQPKPGVREEVGRIIAEWRKS